MKAEYKDSAYLAVISFLFLSISLLCYYVSTATEYHDDTNVIIAISLVKKITAGCLFIGVLLALASYMASKAYAQDQEDTGDKAPPSYAELAASEALTR